MADSDVAVSVGDQLPMLLKNSAYTVDANLQKHTRAPPRTRSGRFQSMLSVRRATPLLVRRLIMVDISIHALRKESDSSTSSSMTANHNIIVLQGKIGIFCHHKQRV